jgi:hypothetical protein
MNGKPSDNSLTVKPPRRRQPKRPGGTHLGQGRSAAARKQAAAILEVLAGTRTPLQAAGDLGVSLARYYQLEQRGLEGLLAACEPRCQGRGRRPVDEAVRLRRENERLQREVGRQQALVRLVQRSVGLPPPPAAVKQPGHKRRARRPVARALAVARRLQEESSVGTAAAAGAEPGGAV